MKNKRIIYWVFGILLFSGITDLALSQERAKTSKLVEDITDKNFKKKMGIKSGRKRTKIRRTVIRSRCYN